MNILGKDEHGQAIVAVTAAELDAIERVDAIDGRLRSVEYQADLAAKHTADLANTLRETSALMDRLRAPAPSGDHQEATLVAGPRPQVMCGLGYTRRIDQLFLEAGLRPGHPLRVMTEEEAAELEARAKGGSR